MQYQPDTLVGQTESPEELGAKPGRGTSGLGVVEGDKMLNAADGSLSELGPGMHRLLLYVAPSPGTSARSPPARLRPATGQNAHRGRNDDELRSPQTRPSADNELESPARCPRSPRT